MIKIIRISNTNNAWNGIKMNIDDFNKLISTLGLSKYRHEITYENDGFPETFIINKKELEKWLKSEFSIKDITNTYHNIQ